MTLGERIKMCRQGAKLSQEKVAELVGVSRQAVTKWEAGQSAPSTENLFRLAEVFGTTVDFLLTTEDTPKQSPAEQVYYLYKMEEEKRRTQRRANVCKRLLAAGLVAVVYLAVYLLGRLIWVDGATSTVVGWLFLNRPSGEHSYLYGWLLSSSLFWWSMGISVVCALLGCARLAWTTVAGFLLGIVLGMIFGPNPAGWYQGNTHYGWAIWGGVYLASIVTGVFVERLARKRAAHMVSEE